MEQVENENRYVATYKFRSTDDEPFTFSMEYIVGISRGEFMVGDYEQSKYRFLIEGED